MNEPLNSEYTFIGGALVHPDLIVVAAVVDDLGERSPAQLYGWLGDDWYDIGTYGWHACGVCILPKSETIVCVGDAGEVAIAVRGGVRIEESLASDSRPVSRIGKLRTVAEIDGAVIVAGMGRQVYMRDAKGSWSAIDNGVRRLEPGGKPVGFEGVDGFALDDLYATGWGGELWHYNGAAWRQQTSPTAQLLTDICCADDGNVYACGRQGMLIVGRDDRWEIVHQTQTIDDFWSLAWFSGELYIATMDAVYVLKNSKLTAVDFGDDVPLTCHDLCVGDGVLCSVGEKDVMLLAADGWRRLD